MKFCVNCRDFHKDNHNMCPKCGEDLGRSIRLAPKPGTPMVPRIFDMMSEYEIEELRKRLLQSSASTAREEE